PGNQDAWRACRGPSPSRMRKGREFGRSGSLTRGWPPPAARYRLIRGALLLGLVRLGRLAGRRDRAAGGVRHADERLGVPGEDLVDEAVLLRLLGAHEVVALGIAL